MQQVNPLLSQRFWGVAVLALITVVGCVAAFLYISPPNEKTIAFYTDDAASIHSGDTVRIAGIIVGKVKDLSIERDQIRVRANIDRNAFVGDQSQVQVRMLTVVGGYYVTVIPMGGKPLGGRVIPKERVTMPYSLVETLSDTTKITEHVSTTPIRQSIDQLQQGLAGTNAESFTTVLNAANSITDTLDKQRGQISKILDLSEEYVQTLTDYKDRLQDYIRKVAVLEGTLILYGKSFSEALQGMGAIVQTAKYGATMPFFTHRQEFINRIQGILDEIRTIASRNGVVVRVLDRIHDRMERALDRQNNFIRPELLATDICVPVHGSPC